jgi:hypothetical protein
MSNRSIKYLNKDFSSIKDQLIDYAKNYFPETYTDFSPASPGMMFIEMVAYVGDILSFYQDIGIQETFLQYAKNPANLYSLAYMLGYRPKVTSAAITDLTVSQVIAADSKGNPDLTQAYRINEGAVIGSNLASISTFITQNTVDFSYSSSYDPTDIVAGDTVSAATGLPTEYTLIKTVKAYSGKIKTVTKTFADYEKYRTFTIQDSNIIGILSAQEVASGEMWYEVPFLGQDTIYEDVALASKTDAHYSLNLKKVSRRFVTRFNKDGYLEVQFGAGMFASDEDESSYLPNPESLGADAQEQSSDKNDVAYDPSNFLFSKSYGLAPTNVSITFTYLVGGGVEANVESNTLTKLLSPSKVVYASGATGSLDLTKLTFTNANAATGGRDGDSLEEIRQNALRSFAEQKRIVTLDDYTVRALAMPARYGNIAKVFATNNQDLFSTSTNEKTSAVALYVLGYDINGKLVTLSDTVKNNLKTYLSEYMMLTDTLYIKDAYVVNLGIQYDIVLKPNYLSTTVLQECNTALADYLDIKKRNVNAVLSLSELMILLSQVKGVQTVKDLKVVDKGGTTGYSQYTYDVDAATRDNVLYPSYDPCVFEIKYPAVDIQGRVTTI